MSRNMQSAVSAFVALIVDDSFRTLGVRATLCIEYRNGAEAEGVTSKDVAEFSREFSAQACAEIRAMLPNNAACAAHIRTTQSRVSEARRVFVALLAGKASARKVYDGSLSVVEFLASLSSKSKGKRTAKMTAKVFAARVRKLFAGVSRDERADALKLLASVVRSRKA